MNRDNVRTSFIIPILFILLVVSIPLNESFGQTEPDEPHEIGILKHQTTVQNNDDSYTLTTHQPYIQNSDGEWVPYILTENDSIVQVESDNLKLVFDKNNGSVTIFDDDGVVIDSDSYVVRTAELNTDIWNNLEINSTPVDRKSTRLNSSHVVISYAVFCLKKKNCSLVHNLVSMSYEIELLNLSTLVTYI